MAKALIAVLLILLPSQGAFTQSLSPSGSSGTMAVASNFDQAPASATPTVDQAPAQGSDQTPAAPATPATPAAPSAPAASADQSATPAAPADTNAPAAVTPSGKSKKIVTSPDTSPPPGGGNGPIVREINIEYIGPQLGGEDGHSFEHADDGGAGLFGLVGGGRRGRNLYATGFFANLAIKDEPLGDGVRVNVVVEPKPLVKEIVIKGAGKIKTCAPERRRSSRRWARR